MLFEPELSVYMEEEAISELRTPVLHKVEIPGLSKPLKTLLEDAQQSQAAYNLDARRYVAGKLNSRYYFETSEIATRNLPTSVRSKRAISDCAQKHAPHFSAGSVFDKAHHPLQEKWSQFVFAATPPDFLKAVQARKEAYRNAFDLVCELVFEADLENMAQRPLLPEALALQQRYYEVESQLIKGLAALYPTSKTPFAAHYAASAMGINDQFSRVWELERKMPPEIVASLREKTPDEDIGDSFLEAQVACSTLLLRRLADATAAKVLQSKQLEQLPVVFSPRITPEQFPYKRARFREEQGALPNGVNNIYGLMHWHLFAVYDITNQMQELRNQSRPSLIRRITSILPTKN